MRQTGIGAFSLGVVECRPGANEAERRNWARALAVAVPERGGLLVYDERVNRGAGDARSASHLRTVRVGMVFGRRGPR